MNGDGETVTDLVKLLCKHVAKDNEGLSSELYGEALGILARNSNETVSDELEAAKELRLILENERGSEAGRRFTDLHRRFQLKSVSSSKFRSALYTFLLKYRAPSSMNNGAQLPVVRHQFGSEITSSSERRSVRTRVRAKTPQPATPAQQQVQQPPPLLPVATGGAPVVSEAALCRDLLHVMQGISGHVIRVVQTREAWSVDIRAEVSREKRELINRLARMGEPFMVVKRFCESSAEKSLGLIAQSFVGALENELAAFYRRLAALDAQLNVELSGRFDHQSGASRVTLRRIWLWAFEPYKQLHCLASLVSVCCGLKGGALITMVNQFASAGDPCIYSMIERILLALLEPWFNLLRQWMLFGNLEDAFHEFFVASGSLSSGESTPCSVWHNKYFIRQTMRPSIITAEQARRILSTGKAVTFLKDICHDTDVSIIQNNLDALLKRVSLGDFVGFQKPSFDALLNEACSTMMKRVVYVMNTDYCLKEHFYAIRQYILLGQGDFAKALMEQLFDILERPAKDLNEFAINGYISALLPLGANPNCKGIELTNQISAHLTEGYTNEKGWDVFLLQYNVTGPISTVLTTMLMPKYHVLFAHIWRTKRISHIIMSMWTDHMVHSKHIRASIPELIPVLHECQILLNEMKHFILAIEYYIAFEVMECSWVELERKTMNADDLDDIIAAHDECIQSVMHRLFLDSGDQMIQVLRGLYCAIEDYKGQQDEYLKMILDEIEKNQGSSSVQFVESVVSKIRSDVKNASYTFRTLLQQFLGALMDAEGDDYGVHFLAVRLDFNRYYDVASNNALSMSLTVFQRQARRSSIMGQSFSRIH